MDLPKNSASERSVRHEGCDLVYSCVGEGPPVLFIQGTALHGDGWLPQIEELASRFTCLWFDNRGMGRSVPRGDAPITVERMADDAAAVLDAVGWERAHVVGHSLGGCIALQLALSAPARMKSLSLLCTAASGPGLVAMTPSVFWRGVRSQVGTMRSRRRAFLENVLTPAAHRTQDLDAIAAELAPLFGHDLGVLPPIALRQVRAMSRWDATARLGELADVPTLVVGAAHDRIARPPLVRALAAGIPGARLVELADEAHGVPITNRARINELLREHLAASAG